MDGCGAKPFEFGFMKGLESGGASGSWIVILEVGSDGDDVSSGVEVGFVPPPDVPGSLTIAGELAIEGGNGPTPSGVGDTRTLTACLMA